MIIYKRQWFSTIYTKEIIREKVWFIHTIILFCGIPVYYSKKTFKIEGYK
jgi:hypothetical protein